MSAVTAVPEHPSQIIGQYIGKVFVLCPKCSRPVLSRMNWNTWKFKCKTCHQTMLIGLTVRIPSRHELKRKHIRPIDTLIAVSTVMEWSNGSPINVLLSDDDDSSDID